MRKLQTLAAASLLVAAALSLAGCAQWFADPAAPANNAITATNKHLKTAAALDAQVQATAASLDSLPYTEAGAKQALTITATLARTLTSEGADLRSAKSAMDSISKADVSAAFKQYAKLESVALGTRITLVDTEQRLYLAMDKLYTGLEGTGAKVDPQAFSVVIGQIRQELSSLTEQAAAQAKAASDYFASQKLGD
jgi:hypothetical protein